MERHIYKGYIIDKDNLGRPYIYNTKSPYGKSADRILVYIDSGKEYSQIKAIIDDRIATGRDTRHAAIDPNTKKIVVLG